MKSDQSRLREAFAEPGSQALLVEADNRFGGWLPLDAVLDHMTVACMPRDGLLVLDLDQPDLLKRAERFERRLLALGCTLLIIKWASGRTTRHGAGSKPYSHQHWVLVAPEDDSIEGLRKSCLAAGLPKSAVRMGQLSRPPLSKHRLGLPTRLLHPSDVATAVAWMTGPRGRSRRMEVQQPGCLLPLESGKPRRDLPSEAWDLARRGNRKGRYENGAHARFGLARYMAEAGWEFHEFLSFIVSPDFAIGDSELGRQRDPITGRVGENQYSQERTHVRMLKMWNAAVHECVGGAGRQASTDPLDHAFQVTAWGERALAYLYADPLTKGTDRQIILALRALLIERNSWTVYPGARGLASRANVTANTAQNCLHRLATYGAISLQQPSTALQVVQSARIHVDPAWLSDAEQLVTGNPVAGWTPDVQSPHMWLPVNSHIWDDFGLGVACLRVYCELTHGWDGTTDLSRRTGIGRNAIARALRSLVEVGTLLGVQVLEGDEESGTWIARPLSDPDAVAQRILKEVPFRSGLTVADRLAALSLRHEAQRTTTLGVRQWEAGRRLAQPA